MKLMADDAYTDAQILCPLKKGIIGVHNINKRVREQKNPYLVSVPELKKGDTIYRQSYNFV